MPSYELPQMLRQLEQKLAATPKLLPVVAANVAEEFLELIRSGYRTETDPYGKPWAPKQVADGRKTLSGPTSRLKNGWHTEKLSSEGFSVATAVVYADYHQRPRPGKRPRRMQVPLASRGLPRKWKVAVTEAANDVLAEHFRREALAKPPTPQSAAEGAAAPQVPGATPEAIAKSKRPKKPKAAKAPASATPEATTAAAAPKERTPRAPRPEPTLESTTKVPAARKPRAPRQGAEEAAAAPAPKAPRTKATKASKVKTTRPTQSKGGTRPPASSSSPSSSRTRRRYRGSAQDRDRSGDSASSSRYQKPRPSSRSSAGFVLPVPSFRVLPQISWKRTVKRLLRKKDDDE